MQVHLLISSLIVFFFMKIFMGLTIEGQNNIPRHGGIIIAPNHLSNWDPPIIGVSVSLRREVFFLAKDELFSISKFYSLLLKKYNCIPVKRHGIDRKSIQTSSFHLKKGRTLVIFPEGKRNIGNGFLKPLPGVGYLALKNRATIVPAYIEGSSENMISLIKRKNRIRVRFGQVIDASKLDMSGSLLQQSYKLSNHVMKKISSLGKNV